MPAQWGLTIPVAVFLLGACTVYDPSLLATNSLAGSSGAGAGGGAGEPGVASGGSGSASHGGIEDDAGASGMNALAGDSGGGQGGAGGNGSAGAGAAGTTAGSGGVSGGGASGVSGGGTGGSVVLALETIDTMEDHDGAIEYVGTRNGDWYAGHDATATGTQTPGSTFTMTMLPTTDTRYNATTDKWAAMTKGSGFTDWGEDMGFNIMLVDQSTNKHPSYDASAYCGIHFFSRVGTGASSTVIVRIPDKNSLPDGGVCGVGGKPCYVYAQKVFSFNTTWTEYNVLFSELKSTGWTGALDIQAIFGVEFGLASSSAFELWVDDISFLKKPSSGVCPTTYP